MSQQNFISFRIYKTWIGFILTNKTTEPLKMCMGIYLNIHTYIYMNILNAQFLNVTLRVQGNL